MNDRGFFQSHEIEKEVIFEAGIQLRKLWAESSIDIEILRPFFRLLNAVSALFLKTLAKTD